MDFYTLLVFFLGVIIGHIIYNLLERKRRDKDE